MDKRYNTLPLAEQLQLRKQAVDEVLAHPEWSLAASVRHLKKTMRLTTAEMAKLSGVGFRTMQDIEQERSEGSVQTLNRILAILGLKLGVARIASSANAEPLGDPLSERDTPTNSRRSS
jgi:transcriptional regulator with XRE-family HTH domain